jgi:hypothetical protein
MQIYCADTLRIDVTGLESTQNLVVSINVTAQKASNMLKLVHICGLTKFEKYLHL